MLLYIWFYICMYMLLHTATYIYIYILYIYVYVCMLFVFCCFPAFLFGSPDPEIRDPRSVPVSGDLLTSHPVAHRRARRSSPLGESLALHSSVQNGAGQPVPTVPMCQPTDMTHMTHMKHMRQMRPGNPPCADHFS